MKFTEMLVLDRLRNAIRQSLGSLDVTRATFGDAPPDRIAVERGMAWPVLDRSTSTVDVLAWIEPLLALGFDFETTDVVDRLGHRRSAYQGLLWYAAMQTIRVSDRVLIGSAAETIVRQLDALRTDIDSAIRKLDCAPPTAAKGDLVAGIVWNAVALSAGAELVHDDVLPRLAVRAVQAIVARQQSAGGYLAATNADNPETLWFHELQIAHAVASLGLQTGDEALISSAARSAAWHMSETQPDHATNQPWGLTAFLIDPSTHLMADGQIHGTELLGSSDHAGDGRFGSGGKSDGSHFATTGRNENVSGVSLILLADALYSTRKR